MLSCCSLQPGPGPHVPDEAKVALQAQPRLARFFVGSVWVGCEQRRGQSAEALRNVAVESGCRLAGDIDQRARLLGVGANQESDIVLLPRAEGIIGREWQHVGLDYSVNQSACVAGKLAGGHPAQLLERGGAQRSRVLLPVAFSIGQHELGSELKRLEQAAALTNGALKQAL